MAITQFENKTNILGPQDLEKVNIKNYYIYINI